MPKCQYCSTSCLDKYILERHQKTERCKDIQSILKELDQAKELVNVQKILINDLNNSHSKELAEHQLDKLNNDKLTIDLKEKNTIIQNLQERAERAEAIVEKAATKPTSVTNILDRSQRTNTVNILSPEPIKFREFGKIGSNFLTAALALKGDEAMANAMMKNVLTDSQGRSKVTCTDLSRQNFKYRDEATGNVISDPQLIQIRQELREATKDTYKDIQMEVYDGCMTNIDKNGKEELDDQYLFQSRDRALFKSGKVVKRIAQKTYSKKAMIKWDDTRPPLPTREEWAAMN